MNDIIEVRNLTKQFMGLTAIDNLTVRFPQGKATGLIGPNGSGKTTLMNVLSGLLSPEQGEIIIKDKLLHKINPIKLRKLKIARTFQDGRLVEQMSVEDNLLSAVAENNYWRAFLELNSDKYNTKLEDILKTTGLTEHRYKKAEDLSYGLRKLLEIGRALMQDAEIYFLDEPFTGLFPEVVEKICQIMEDLKTKQKTIVIIEHNMSLIQRICDYTIVLDHGTLLAKGTSDKVLQNKKVQEAYLGV